jgi:hypothetical protein
MELISKVRGDTTREKSVLAELAGEMEFGGTERRPKFTITSGLPKPIEDISPEPLEDEALQERVLRFELDPTHFAAISSERGTEFIVKLDPERFHYLEIGASIELGGAEESDLARNELLDVLITDKNPPPIEEAVFVIQRDGEPMVGAEVELEDRRGRKIARVTDDGGVARVRGRSGTPFSLVSVREEQQSLAVAKFQLEGEEPSALA